VFDNIHADDPHNLSVVIPSALYTADFSRYLSLQSQIETAKHLKEWIIHMPVAPTVTPGALNWKTSAGTGVQVRTLLPLNASIDVYDEQTRNRGWYIDA